MKRKENTGGSLRHCDGGFSGCDYVRRNKTRAE